MRYELRLTAYDVMDQVWVSMALYGTTDTPTQQSGLVLATNTRIQGTGTTEPREWLEDALLAALEDL